MALMVSSLPGFRWLSRSISIVLLVVVVWKLTRGDVYWFSGVWSGYCERCASSQSSRLGAIWASAKVGFVRLLEYCDILQMEAKVSSRGLLHHLVIHYFLDWTPGPFLLILLYKFGPYLDVAMYLG